jgi:hypothetical protein
MLYIHNLTLGICQRDFCGPAGGGMPKLLPILVANLLDKHCKYQYINNLENVAIVTTLGSPLNICSQNAHIHTVFFLL